MLVGFCCVDFIMLSVGKFNDNSVPEHFAECLALANHRIVKLVAVVHNGRKLHGNSLFRRESHKVVLGEELHHVLVVFGEENVILSEEQPRLKGHFNV